jgi:hypothetical protein
MNIVVDDGPVAYRWSDEVEFAIHQCIEEGVEPLKVDDTGHPI